MKRYGNLFEQVVDLDNLRLADEKARKGKGNSYGVKIHDKQREKNILALHDALISGNYHTSEYTYFKVYEPKERDIARLPYYPDRIVHHAIMNVLEPIWVKTFTHNTFSCIKNRGVHACRAHVQKIIRSFKGRRLYCLKVDIKKFYPSVKNCVLVRLVRRKLKDVRLLGLLDEIIHSADGLPIGNYLSQYLANLTLTYIMHWANEVVKVKASEYADDICFFEDNKERLHEVLEGLKLQLFGIGLRLKENFQIFPIAMCKSDRLGRALDYVGFCFYRVHVGIRKSIKQALCRRLAVLKRIEGLTAKAYKMAICGWLGWCKYSDSKHLMRRVINIDFYDSIFKQKARCA